VDHSSAPNSDSAVGFSSDVTVVVITRDRRLEVLRTLARLRALPERPPVIVVDNASADGTPVAVAQRFPDVLCLRAKQNLGATARNVGVRLATTPYVAFADDDSWWEPGALRCAARHFDEYPRLGLAAARVLVGENGRVDPVSDDMAAAPIGRADDLPGPSITGFLACAAVVRRSAFLAVGGFDELIFFGGEE
jgi:GT2 family glycosyltransferase